MRAAALLPLFAAFSVAGGAAVLPSGWKARFTAAKLSGDATTGKLASWTEEGLRFTATQATEASKPKVLKNLMYCSSGVQFSSGTFMDTADHNDLDPDAGGFTVFALTKQDSYGSYGEAVIKGYSVQSWEMSHGAAGGTSLMFFYGTTPQANTYLPYTDTTRWGTWAMLINVTSGSGTTSTKTVLGYLDGKRTGWLNGNFGATSNTYTGSLNSIEGLHFGATSGLTYSGTILEVLIYKETLDPARMTQVYNYLDETYYLTCPTLNSMNATNGDGGKVACVGARFGDECRQTCDAGLARTYGTTEHQCSVGEWSGAPIKCESVCPPLVAPQYIGTCSRTLVNLQGPQLTGGQAFFDTGLWAVVPQVPRSKRSSYWDVSGSNIVSDTSAVECGAYLPSVLVMSAPAWADSLPFSTQVVIESQVAITAGSAGFVFRYQNPANHYRLILTADPSALNARRQVLISVKNGVQTTIANVSYPVITSITYTVKITLKGPSIQVEFDAGVRMNVTNSDSTLGSVGLLTNGGGRWLNFKVTSDCDAGGNCLNAAPGTTCTYTCASGYTAIGSTSRTCTAGLGSAGAGASDWNGGAALVCSINPPTINTTAQSVKENSGIDALVGRPVEVYSSALRTTLQFSIDSEVPAPTNPLLPRFGIDSCSGQIYVANTNDPLDFETLNTYSLNIRVIPNGFTASAATATIPIKLLDVNEAAIFAGKPTISRSVPENSAANALVGLPLAAVDPDTARSDINLYTLELDSSGGLFNLNSRTGQLTVNRSNTLNFEVRKDYQLRVRVTDSLDASLTDAINVDVMVADANDPPTMPATQSFDISELDAVANTPFPFPVTMTDEDVKPPEAHVFTITAGNRDPNDLSVLAMFGIDSTTGVLKWVEDRSVWPANNVPVVVDNRLVRAVYTVTVQVADSQNVKAQSNVKVYLLANVTNRGTVTVDSIKVGDGATTADAPSSGGTNFYIYGTGFQTRYTVTAWYGYTVNGNMTRGYTTTCTVLDAQTVKCTTRPGVGRDLVVELTVKDGANGLFVTKTAALFISYAPPTVTAQTGGSYIGPLGTWDIRGMMETKGGSEVTLTGTNFGSEPTLVTVTYGDYQDYYFTGTVVSCNHNTLKFLGGPGQGGWLYFKVEVGGQAVEVLDYTMALGYREPNITRLYVSEWSSYTLMTIPTSAWELIYIEGTNFGPNYVKGEWQTPNAYYGPVTNPYQFTMEYCGKYYGEQSHTLMYCYTTESWGTNLSMMVEAGWQYSEFSHLTAVNNTGYFGHVAPAITTVSGAGTRNADTAGGQIIDIDGTGLGPLKLTDETYPDDIEVRYGNRFQYPDDVDNWRMRYQYRAKKCRVTVSDYYSNRMTCETNEGTGINHDFRVMIGGQLSNSMPRAISYGPPIVASFDDAGAANAVTSGGQNVTIYGKNFGNDMSLVSVTYSLDLDPALNSGVPATALFSIVTAGVTRMTFKPTGCTYLITHTQLQCVTSWGGGSNLKWTVVVDNQTSRDPFTFYGLAQVINITDKPLSVPGAVAVTNANPNGGDIVYLEGLNFGPRTSIVMGGPKQLLQWVRYGLPGGTRYYVPRTDIIVTSHTRMGVRLGPGYGQNLRFELCVADQESGPTSATFSYAKPTIQYISPTNGSTLSTAANPVRINVYATNLPMNDTATSIEMVFGNAQDNTLLAGGYIVCSRNARVPGLIQSVSCVVPSGNGLRRQVQLRLVRPGVAGSEVYADQSAPFNYFNPQVDFIAVVPATDAAYDADVRANFGARADAVRVIEFHGANFGAYANDQIRRLVEYRDPIANATWLTAPSIGGAGVTDTLVQSWSHTKIVLFTLLTSAEARITIQSRDYDASGTWLTQQTAAFDISDSLPEISAIVGAPANGFSTAGGETLQLQAPLRTISSGSAITVSVGRSPYTAQCAIMNRKFDNTGVGDGGLPAIIPDASVPSFLRSQCLAQNGAGANPNSQCTFFCQLPPTNGGEQSPVILLKDGTMSGAVFIKFTPPVISTIRVVDNFEVPAATTDYNVLLRPTDEVVAPTAYGYLEITGTNFGVCPMVVMGDSQRFDTCSLLGNASTAADVGHTRLYIPILEGEGSRANASGMPFSLYIEAAGQKNKQPSTLDIRFRYAEPTVTTLSPTTGPTKGGSYLTITGKNFGATNPGRDAYAPLVALTNAADGYAPLYCIDVQRISHTMLTCLTPPGSGANLEVTVQALDQIGSSAAAGTFFTYDRPVITHVAVETWPDELFDAWPTAWAANRSLFTPTEVNYTVGQLAHGPTTGRYKVKIAGANFGPANPAMNCIFSLFNFATRDCSTPANSITRFCRCRSLAFPAGDPQCAVTYADEIASMSPSAGFPMCNGWEDYVGEGEVYNDGGAAKDALEQSGSSLFDSSAYAGSGYVLSWADDLVEIMMPPGAGEVILTVGARGQFPLMYNDMVFTYDAPVITEGPVKLSGQLQTGPGANDILELRGRNLGFGFPPDTVDTLPGGFFMFPGLPASIAGDLYAQRSLRSMYRLVAAGRALPIAEEDAVPAFHTTLKWWQFCISNALQYETPEPMVGYRRDPALAKLACQSKNYTAFTILKHTHNSIILRSHPGVGANHQGLLQIHSPELVMSSTNFTFSYDRPLPIRASPATIYIPTATRVVVSGYNFGDFADEKFWTPEMRPVVLQVDGEVGTSATRYVRTVSNFLQPLDTSVGAIFSNLTVGKKDVFVTVVGQTGVLYKNTTWSDPLYAVCAVGYFGHLGESCLACPNGATCLGYLADLEREVNASDPIEANIPHSYPRPQFMFFNLNGSMASACPQRDPAYGNRDVCIVGCIPPEACAGDNFCTEGYASKAPMFRCGSCAQGFYKRGMECVKCPDSPWMLVIGFLLLALSMCVAGYFLNKQNVNIAFLSIAVDYFQVVSMFAQSRIAWPAEIKLLLHVLSAFNLNIEIIAPECIKPDISYSQKWSGIMALPFSAMILFVMFFIGGYLYKRCVLGQRGRAFLTAHKNSLIAMFLILFYFMYLYITRSMLEVFNCINAEPPDGKLYLSAVFEECGRPGGTQLTLMPFAITGLIVYVAGYPLGAIGLFHKYRFQIMLDQLLRARGTGDSQLTNPHAHVIRVRFSRMYYQYKPDTFWWMEVVLLRKFFIAFTSLMFRRDGGFQMAVCLLILFASYALQVRWNPFMSPSDRQDVLRDHDRAKFEGGIHSRLAEAIKDASAIGRKRTTKIDWTAPKSIVGKQILARAGLFMFNYNTVEAIMLGCAIMVSLAGIMFESLARQRANDGGDGTSIRVVPVADRRCGVSYTSYCTGLMYGVILLIAASIIYLVVVITVEIYSAVQEAQMARANAVQRAKMAKKLGLDGPGGKSGMKGAIGRQLSKSLKGTDADSVQLNDAAFQAKIGVLETAVNPLFASGGAKAGNAAAGDKKDGMDATELFNAAQIADMVQPPNPALWSVLRGTFAQLVAQTDKQTQLIADLKKQVATLETMGGNVPSTEEEAAAVPSPSAAVRMAQRAAMADGSNPLAAYRPAAANRGPAGGSASKKSSFAPALSRED